VLTRSGRGSTLQEKDIWPELGSAEPLSGLIRGDEGVGIIDSSSIVGRSRDGARELLLLPKESWKKEKRVSTALRRGFRRAIKVANRSARFDVLFGRLPVRPYQSLGHPCSSGTDPPISVGEPAKSR